MYHRLLQEKIQNWEFDNTHDKDLYQKLNRNQDLDQDPDINQEKGKRRQILKVIENVNKNVVDHEVEPKRRIIIATKNTGIIGNFIENIVENIIIALNTTILKRKTGKDELGIFKNQSLKT